MFELERVTGLTSVDRELIAISSYQDWRQSADREIRAVWTSLAFRPILRELRLDVERGCRLL